MVKVEQRPTLEDTFGKVDALISHFYSLYSGSDKHTLWMMLNRVKKSLHSKRTSTEAHTKLPRDYLASTIDQHPPIQVALDPGQSIFPQETLAGLLKTVYQRSTHATALEPHFRALTTVFDGIVPLSPSPAPAESSEEPSVEPVSIPLSPN